MKKATSIILILSAIISLSACGSGEETETAPQETTPTLSVSETSTSATTQQTTKTTEKSNTSTKPVTNNLLEVNKKDKETFCKTLEQILWSNGWFEEELNGKLNFDCEKSDAYRIAIDRMISCPFYDLMDELKNIYGGSNYDFEPESNKNDPKGQMTDTGYKKIKAEKFDSVLQNMFNVKPDHKFTVKDNESNNLAFYYYDGYYYIMDGDGGDVAEPIVTIESITRQDDGKYNCKILYQVDNRFDDPINLARLNVSAALKSVNGDRLWSFYKIEITKIYENDVNLEIKR